MPADAAKPTILIVEDELGPRNALQVILRPFYNLRTVDSGNAAMQALKEAPVDLITLDMKLPDQHGLDVLQQIKTDHQDVAVIVITGYGSLQSAMDAIRYGASHYLLKPFNVTELLAIINQTLEKKRRLEILRQALDDCHTLWGTEKDAAGAWTRIIERYDPVRPKTKPDMPPSSDTTLLLMEILEAYDRDLFNHSTRTSFYAALMGKQLRLSDAERKSLVMGAFVHDIGSILLPRWPERQSVSTVQLRQHPEVGARMLLPLRLAPEVGQIVLYHHEHYDGQGYPYGLQGEGIPLLARVVGIAQAFDHLTVDHPGRAALSVDEAIQRIKRLSGSRFDPDLVDVITRAANDSATALPTLAASSRQPLMPEL